MSAIDDKYAALGGPAGFLGAPTTPETFAPDGVGRFRHYQHGSIYWTPATGAHEVHGAIRWKWSSLGWERSFLGYPLTDETATPDGVGRFNHFQGGSIYWTPATGAREVHGAIRAKWESLGWERSFLGYPLTDETTTPDGVGRFNHFQGGSIYWTPQTGAHEVHGAIRAKWESLSWERGFLGYPLTDETTTPDGIGRFNHFQGGSIYWTPQTGAHEVHGAIRAKWESLSWERGFLGYPLTDETATPDGVGRFNHFQGGSVYWTPQTGAHEVHGDIRGRWAALGWERSALRYPTSDELVTPHGGGRVSHFQGGSIYWDPGRGAYEVWPPPPPEVCDGARQGRWQVPSFNSGVVGVHAALLRTNRVLFFTYRDPGPHAAHAPQPHGDSSVLDLAAGTVTRPPLAPGEMNLFCAGQALMADGRLFIGGGEREHVGVRSLHTFTPGGASGGTWQHVGDMPDGRWYATCVTLHDGRIFILGGRAWTGPAPADNRPNATFEVFDPASGTLQPRRPAPLLAEAGGFDTYPFVYVLPSGKLLAHIGTQTRFLNMSTMNFEPAVLEAAARPGRAARTYGFEGTSVLLPLSPTSSPPYRARVMVMGGAGAPGADIRTPATNSCEILDTGEAAPAWRLAAPMARPRVMPDAVLLPDGKVLVMNGSSTGVADNGANPVYEAELYDPASNTWATLCRMTVPRLYHATALLLPDGRVMTAGTDSMWNPDPFHEAQLSVEIFSPPYMFRGARPAVTGAPAEIVYNIRFSVTTPDAGSVTSAALLRCGSVTHSFNSDQRYVGLTITARTASGLTLQAPPNGLVAPPGYYLLFILRDGVPSVGRFVRLLSL